MNALLIEDNPDHAALIREYLQQGYQGTAKIDTCETIKEASAKLRGDHKYTVMFADLNLPDSDIKKTMHWLSQLNVTIPIIVLTSRSDLDYAKGIIRHGIQDYLTKDLLNAELLFKTTEYAIERKLFDSKLRSEIDERKSFCNSLSHDIYVPIRRIHFLAQALLEEADEFTDNTRHNINSIINQAKRVEALMIGLESYLKSEILEESLTSIDLNRVIQEIIEFNGYYLQERNAIVKVQNSLGSVIGESSKITLIFQNILLNAVKYNESSPRKVDIEGKIEGDMYTVTVRDNGIGIESEGIGDIFTPFYRLVSRSQYEGTGLGLSIVKRIVNQLGGRIWVESTIGQGSTFNVSLKRSIL
jgi:light-regulated signal transduction histidine kinase (bacteriophytochrome)